MRLSIRKKIIIGSVGTALLAGILALVGVYGFQTIEGTYRRESAPYMESYEIEDQIARELEMLSLDANSLIGKEAPETELQRFKEQLEERKERIADLLGRLEKLNEPLVEFIEKWGDVVNQYVDTIGGAYSAIEKGESPDVVHSIMGEATTLEAQRVTLTAQLIEVQNRSYNKALDNIWRKANVFRVIIIVICVVVFLVAVTLVLVTFRAISAPIKELTAAVIDIDEGELGGQVEVKSQDDLGVLASSFNKMSTGLKVAHDELKEERDHLEEMVDERTVELKESEAQLQVANKELEGYAHTVSHDLKGPMSSIRLASEMLLELLKESPTDETKKDIKEFGEFITGGIDKSSTLIDDLLVLAEAGQEPREISYVDTGEVVEQVLKENAKDIEEKSVHLKVDDNLGHLRANPTQIYQVFSNLVRNAFRHNDSEEPVVEVSFLGDDKDGAHRYLVRDNGSGIQDEQLDTIFLPFFKGKSGDTGIGLSTVEKIVKVYGGDIRAYNDNGACFEFRLMDYHE